MLGIDVSDFACTAGPHVGVQPRSGTRLCSPAQGRCRASFRNSLVTDFRRTQPTLRARGGYSAAAKRICSSTCSLVGFQREDMERQQYIGGSSKLPCAPVPSRAYKGWRLLQRQPLLRKRPGAPGIPPATTAAPPITSTSHSHPAPRHQVPSWRTTHHPWCAGHAGAATSVQAHQRCRRDSRPPPTNSAPEASQPLQQWSCATIRETSSAPPPKRLPPIWSRPNRRMRWGRGSPGRGAKTGFNSPDTNGEGEPRNTSWEKRSSDNRARLATGNIARCKVSMRHRISRHALRFAAA
jgi:hypothetical protein